ncbi:hypothetical protein AAJ72_01640 [Citromicrobium sp. RCC1885]|uniref:hypothetical protein n=1 Tax=unclassified Citromicrobium TaxID=2630544 RepID=UPI0006C931EC|nr:MULTISPECIES: hypothetical protein [unclassified Citromicrobium]KPM24491.1 hypothetical protein AAJ72_01640 [Citromicrobium sp. RCC1885]KPM27733.1 hypothetical protein AAJ74_02385 [Citromicrobium sp. RCC1878]OAM10771.1 hypothetical protein A0U43_07025 [Citromicrobium sp. RCC1897]|tara:strand:+ start:4151 stop:4405 length:255 start_codon:yes stop_codon:yes gene_type:complete
MGFLILICSGGVIGWIVALVTGADDARSAWLRIALGAGATVVSGMAVSDTSLIGSLGANALLVAIAIGLAVLAIVSFAASHARR